MLTPTRRRAGFLLCSAAWTAAVLVLSVAVPAVLFADVVDIPAHLAPDATDDTWTFGGYNYQVESDLDSSGDMSRHTAVVGVGHRISLTAPPLGTPISQAPERLYIAFQGTYVGSYYDLSPDAGLMKWGDIHSFSLLSLLGWRLDDSWTLLGGGLGRLSMEGGASVTKSLTGGGVVGFEYAASQTLELGLLIGATSQLEDTAALLAVPTVDWRFSEGGRFRLGLSYTLGQPGVGPELTFALADNWQVGIGASYQKRRFRLDFDGALGPGVPSPISDGVGEETALPVYVLVRHSVTSPQLGVWYDRPFRHYPDAFFDLYAGVSLGGELRVEDDSGDRLRSESYDPAATVGFRIQILF